MLSTKKAIVLTTFRRPDYLKTVLESISKNEGLEDYTLCLACEPGFQDVLRLCQEVKFMKRVITVNPRIFGVRENPFLALKRAFELGAEAVLYCEDDVPISTDTTRLFEFCLGLPDFNERLCLNLYNPESNPEKPNAVILKKDTSALGIGMSKEQWKKWFEPLWHADIRGWDWSFSQMLEKEPTVFTVQPALSRSTHIGVKGGVHYVPAQHDKIYLNKPWHQVEPVKDFKYER